MGAAKFLRHKRIGKYTYLCLVESVYEDGRMRRHIIRNLGRREDVEAGGDLERLAASAVVAVVGAGCHAEIAADLMSVGEPAVMDFSGEDRSGDLTDAVEALELVRFALRRHTAGRRRVALALDLDNLLPHPSQPLDLADDFPAGTFR